MDDDSRAPITRALLSFGRGEEGADEALFELVYPELRRLARRQLGMGRRGATLETSGLVHEAYLKLVDAEAVGPRDRTHFFALMARVMRQVVVDHARRRLAAKRGGGVPAAGLDEERAAGERAATHLLDLERALARLERADPRLARVVECRFFSGYTEEETAEVLDLSLRTVQRSWTKARAWLRLEMEAGEA